MTIIEQNLVPKSPTKKSEDGIVVTKDYIAVIDGSTSKSAYRYSRSCSNGCYAMRIVANFIRKAPANMSCQQFCKEVTKAVRKHYTSHFSLLSFHFSPPTMSHLSDHPEDRLCASAVVYSRLRREVWMIGDCQCLIGDQLIENPKPYELPLAEQRAAEVRRLLASGTTVSQLLADDVARRSIIPQMITYMKGQTIDYSVIDGFPIPQSKVRIITLDFQPWEVVLASDGYPFLCPTLQESEQKLQWQRKNDPLNIGQFKATKAFVEGNNSFDDRSYIRFKV